MTVMLDTNILIYHLTQNHPEHGPACTDLLNRVAAGAETVYCPSAAVMECTFVLGRQFAVPRAAAAKALIGILSRPNVSTEVMPALISGLTFWAQQSALVFADCYHLALASELDTHSIYSFDRRMDRYHGVERIEP